MKKKILSLALAFVLTLALVPAFTAPAQAAGTWQEAYAEFLRTQQESFSFALYDMDKNSTPELLISTNRAGGWIIYTHANNSLQELYKAGVGAGTGDVIDMLVPANPNFAGLFFDTIPTGRYFISIENNKMTVLSENKGQSINNDEYQKSTRLETYPINVANIQTYIVGAVTNTNPHPYATALKEFFKDAKDKTTAWLCDINGDNVQEMLAWKDIITGNHVRRYARFFHIYNGELRTFDWDYSETEWAIFFSSANKLVCVDNYHENSQVTHFIASLTNGELNPYATAVRTQNGVYIYGDKNVSKTEYDGLLRQFGIESPYVARSDQTAAILAMTAEIKVTAPPANRHYFATELEKFYSGVTGYKAAVLADLDGDKALEMIAVKELPLTGESYGDSISLDIGVFSTKNNPSYYSGYSTAFRNGSSVYVSDKNYLILNHNGFDPGKNDDILQYKSGTIQKIDSLSAFIDIDASYIYGGGKPISKSQYDNECVKYGVDKAKVTVFGNNTKDQTAEILAMTATSVADKPSSWAETQVNAAITASLVPQSLQAKYTQPTTRAEFCTLAVALYEKQKGTITGRTNFADTSDVNVQKAASVGIVSGVGDNKFSPDTQLTREQAAVMLARLADAIGKPLPKKATTFADKGSISNWAVDAVGQIQAAGIMSGVGDNKFAPQQPYTREQSIITIMRLYDVVK